VHVCCGRAAHLISKLKTSASVQDTHFCGFTLQEPIVGKPTRTKPVSICAECFQQPTIIRLKQMENMLHFGLIRHVIFYDV